MQISIQILKDEKPQHTPTFIL